MSAHLTSVTILVSLKKTIGRVSFLESKLFVAPDHPGITMLLRYFNDPNIEVQVPGRYAIEALVRALGL